MPPSLGSALPWLLAEGLVQQVALLAHQAAQFLHRSVIFLFCGVWPPLPLAVPAMCRFSSMDCSIASSLGRHLAVAACGQLLDGLQQRVQIVLAQGLGLAAGGLAFGAGLAASACM